MLHVCTREHMYMYQHYTSAHQSTCMHVQCAHVNGSVPVRAMHVYVGTCICVVCATHA